MAIWIRKLADWKWTLVAISIAFVAVSILLSWAAICWGANSKDVLIGIATGLFTGVVVTVVVAVVEERREAAIRDAEEKRENAIRDAEDRREAAIRAQTRRLSVELAASLDYAKLEGEDLTGINLSGKKMRLANLKDAILVGADLSECNLDGADLTGADLTDSEIEGANLENADLRSTKFIRASAQGVNFKSTDVNRETDFTRADLRTLWIDTDDEPAHARRELSKNLILRSLLPPKTTSFRGAKMYSSDGSRQEIGTLTAPEVLYDRDTDWPEFQTGLPPGAKLDNSVVDVLSDIDRQSLTENHTALHDKFMAEIARWEYRVEPLIIPDKDALVFSAKDMANLGWELVGVIELEVGAVGPNQHLIYKRERVGSDSGWHDWEWIERFWSGR